MELVAERAAVGPGTRATVGVHLILEKGWHTYWRNPGDTGQPPRVAWTLPPGASAGEILWPAPKRIESAGAVSFGYEDEALLLAVVDIPKTHAQRTFPIRARVSWVVCREICVPGKADAELLLPFSQNASLEPGAGRPLIRAARRRLPKRAAHVVGADVAGDELVLTFEKFPDARSAAYFPFSESVIENRSPQRFAKTETGFVLRVAKSAQYSPGRGALDGVVVPDGDPFQAVSISPKMKMPPKEESR
ncbi:MAG: hypothetical protein HY059_10245 [Proteobacteria bacterium]|nr:hypothetical protein [Pseudomonadota bacterium]